MRRARLALNEARWRERRSALVPVGEVCVCAWLFDYWSFPCELLRFICGAIQLRDTMNSRRQSLACATINSSVINRSFIRHPSAACVSDAHSSSVFFFWTILLLSLISKLAWKVSVDELPIIVNHSRGNDSSRPACSLCHLGKGCHTLTGDETRVIFLRIPTWRVINWSDLNTFI